MGSEELEAPLLPQVEGGLHEPPTLVSRTWTESKKLWQIVAPAIFSRLTMYGINVISQAFAGHLGDLELASVSIATTVIVGLNFGLLLGMASALETLCGQAYGAKKYHMLGVYMQRSWIILTACALLLLPVYVFAEPILLLFGQPRDIAAMTGAVAVWFIPQHFSFVFLFPLQRFLQCQLKNGVTAYASAAALAFHVVASYLLIVVGRLGIVGIAVSLNLSWWVSPAVMFLYITWSPGCARSWTGFSFEAFSGLWEFLKLSAASGVMLCLENWYYRVLVLLAGNMKNAQVAVDALSICMSINGWELMIPFAFFAGTGVRVANELGAGNGKGARFATVVSIVTSSIIGLFFWALIVAFHDKFALIFTSSVVVLKAVDKLSILLAFTILLNSVQPILSGVAVGSGWQTVVAYVNIGSYYIIGVPFGVLLGWVFHLDVLGLWAGMIGGTAVQTIILTIFTVRCDWEKEAMKASTRVDKWETRK